MVERFLRHLPWYSLETESERQAQAQRLADRAHSIRVSANRVIDDYKQAEDALLTRRKP